jgi:sialidase-1
MTRTFSLTAVLAVLSVAIGFSVRPSRCFADPAPAKLLPAEFVQPPKIFVRHTAKIEYCGAAVVRLASGKLVLPGWKFESTDGGRSWTPTKTDPWLDSREVIRLRDGRWAAVVSRPPAQPRFNWNILSIRFSSDEAKTWSKPVDFRKDAGPYAVMNERLIETRQGALVLALAYMPAAEEHEADKNSAGCFYSTDGGKTWSLTEKWAKLEGDRGMQEPTIAELADGRLIMLARTGKGCHHRSYSSDGGRTWSTPQPTTLTAACSPLTMKTMSDGRLFVVYDHSAPMGPEAFFPRRPLAWAVSSDGGATWSPPHEIDAEQGQQHIYPSITFLADGILIVYASVAADPNGTFANGGPEGWKIGGGKSCIIKYP